MFTPEAERWLTVQGGDDLTEHPAWQCVGSVDVVGDALVIEAGDGYVTPRFGQGPYVRARGDFGLSASVDVATQELAAIVAFGALPKGEWWRDIRRLDFGLAQGQATLIYWDGTAPRPAFTQNFAIASVSDSVELSLRRVGDQLVFRVDGQEVGRIQDPGAFPENRAYLGANVAPGNRLTIDRLTIEAKAGQESEIEIVEPKEIEVADLAGPPLRELAARREIRIGAAVAPGPLRCEPAYAGVLAREFNAVTTENALKFGPVHPARERYDFEDADAIVEFAASSGTEAANDIWVRGHTLVWHNQQPAWITETTWTRDELIEVLREHITTVVRRYRGRVQVWDVVNEAVTDNGLLRNTVWLQAIGPEYIEMAFRWAHEADPEALLFYNDYGAEGLNRKSDAIYELVQDLVARGVPIHGVGLQAHLAVTGPPILDNVRANMQRLGDLGLQVHITELDVRVRDDPSAAELERQAQIYGNLLATCLSVEECTAFVLWGFTDRHSWIPGFRPGWGSALIFDESYQPKPAYWALRETLAGD
jgi:endo-1,4-beta-xylanase